MLQDRDLVLVRKLSAQARTAPLRLWRRSTPVNARYLSLGFSVPEEHREKHHSLVF